MSRYGPKFSTRRRLARERDDDTCQECGDEGWQVHHKRYAPEGDSVGLEDLVTLCPWCHGDKHDRTYIAPKEKPTRMESTASFNITDEQNEWLSNNPGINLSLLTRYAIDKAMQGDIDGI